MPGISSIFFFSPCNGTKLHGFLEEIINQEDNCTINRIQENSYLVFPPTNIYSLCSSFCDAQTFQWSTWHWLLHKFPLTLPNFLNLTQPLTSESYCLVSVWSTTRLTSQEADEIGGSKILPSGKGFWSHSVFSRSCTGVGTMAWWSYGGNMVTSPDALTL